MLVGDLYLGDVEGSEEFNSKASIDNLYFMGVSTSDIENLMSGRKRYIHGYKGTGKTSLIKLLETRCKDEHISYFSISYRKIREDAEVVHEFRERFRLFRDTFTEEEDRDTTTLTFWKWYLLSLIARQFLGEEPDDLIQSTRQKFFRAIASVLDMLVVIFDPNGNVIFGLKTDKALSTDENASISEAAQSIRRLAKKIHDRLDSKVIIFIDELELTRARSTYDVDRTMIKNLVIATKHINEISKNLHIVLAVRDEVVYDLRGDEINKLLDGFGVSLTWWTNTRVTLDHHLWRLMFKKIRFSMKINNDNPDILTDAELWQRWFPFSFGNKESWKVFFELTWARPRDFVRLLSLMRDQCRDAKCFSNLAYDLALRSYSQSALSEISEEISTLFDDETMRKVQKIIQSLGVNFTPSQFIECERKVGISTPSIILDEMYRVGFIGNHYREESFPRWLFFYRNNKIPDMNRPFEVHKALHYALGIKGRFSTSVYYSG